MALNIYYARLSKPVETSCSCTKCENKECLGKRQENIACESCSCEDCQEPKTCLLYNKTDKHSVGCGASVPADATLAPATGDGYETKFITCCDGKPRLRAPGYVFNLSDCSAMCCTLSKAKKQSESAGYVLELPKQGKNKNDCKPGYKSVPPKEKNKQNDCCASNENINYSLENEYVLTKCLQKPHAQTINRDSSNISAGSKNSFKELAGIVYDLTNTCTQKRCQKCNKSAKNKSESFVCGKQSLENNDHELINKNEHECSICQPKNKNKHECNKCKPINKNDHKCNNCKHINKDEFEPMKCKQAQIPTHGCCLYPANDISSYVLDLQKKSSEQSHDKCPKCTKSKKYESHKPTTCTQKPQSQKNRNYFSRILEPPVKANSCSCHEKANSQTQSKNKSELAGGMLGRPTSPAKHGHDCNNCKKRNENEYKPKKCIQSQKNTDETCQDLAQSCNYVLDLRKKSSELNDGECCIRTKRNESIKYTQKPQLQNNSHECCHYSAKHKFEPESPAKLTHTRESPKSTTTCSLECKKNFSQPVETPTIRELTLSTNALSHCLYHKRTTPHFGVYTSMSDKRNPCCEPKRTEDSKISSPDEMYAIMTDTLKKQTSVVETQKESYLPTMTTKLDQPNNVEILKNACLPRNSLTWDSKCMPKNKKKSCTCKQNHRTDLSKVTKKHSPHKLCKNAQSLSVAKQSCSCREPHTRTSKNYSCEKEAAASEITKGIRELQPPVTESFKDDNLTICKTIKKKRSEEKCTCKPNPTKDKNQIIDSNENVQIYRCMNETTHNAYKNKQELLNHLHGNAACAFELPNALDTKKQRSKENQIEIQYFPNARLSRNSEKAIAITTSNSSTRLSNSDQEDNTLACNMLNDVSKISSSSKTKTAQESDKNTQQINVNKHETSITSETMHIFYNRNSSECNELAKITNELPSYSVKSQQYTPTNNAQELFKNILQTHGDEIETLVNTYQKKCSECNTFIKYEESESSGYLNDLPLSSLISITQSLCRESARSNSKSSGYLPKPQAYRTSAHESAFRINRLETNTTASFGCKDLVKQGSVSSRYENGSTAQNNYENKNGYVFELSEYKSDKPGCGKSSQLPGYISGLPKNKSKFDSCSSSQLGSKSEVLSRSCSSQLGMKSSKCRHKAVNKAEGLCCSSFTKLAKKTSKCHHQAAHDSEVLSKSSSTQLKKISSICRHKAVNKVQGLRCSSPKKIVATKSSTCSHKAPIDSKVLSCYSPTKLVKTKSSTSSHKASIDSEVLSWYSPTKLTKKSSKCHHQAIKDPEVLCCCSAIKVTKKSSQCQYKAIIRLLSKSVQSDAENVRKNVVGTQTNTVDNLDLQKPPSENTIELCKDILKTQIHTIDVLKKIYFPQINSANSIQKTESSNNTCCTALPSLTKPTFNTTNKTMQLETVNLSADLLNNASFTQLNDSLACRQSNNSSRPKIISTYDILKRLKEAYKACSCKICECVTNKSVKPDVCKCKPCECVECKSSFISHKKDDRQICDCKPCDCVQCTKHLAEQLHKDSNQCGVGEKRNVLHCQTLIVAPVEIEDNAPRVACTCSPCACIECGLVYPLGSSLINEMSTSTNRHALCRCEICLNENCDRSGFYSCNCQMRKVMSKPVENDIHDYDIRTAMILRSKPIFQKVVRNDPIAMISAVTNSHPRLENGQSNSQTCNRKECECISSVSQKDPTNTIKCSQFLSNEVRSYSDFNDRIDNHEFKTCQIYKKIQIHDRVFETCSSLNCETLKHSSEKPKNLHRFEIHQYSDDTCLPLNIKETPKSVLHPFKKGDVLTPSTHKLKVQNLIKQRQHLEPRSKSKATTNSDLSSTQQDVKIFYALNPSNKINSIPQANIYMNDFKSRYIDKRKTLKYDAYMYCQGINKKRPLNKNMVMVQNDISGKCFSDDSSSCYKGSSSNTKNTRSNNRFRVSSLHSSIHNCPEYLIQIRKGTIEKNLKGVMKLDNDEKIKLNKCNSIPTSIEKHNVDKISFINNSGDEDYLKTNHSENAVIRSFQSNYKFGLRNNLHVQLSNKTEKRKNCENNGIQNKERDQLQLSACLTSSLYSVKINNENCEYLNAINDFNEFYVKHKVFDYNISARHSVTIHDEQSGLVRSAEMLNATDYKRVSNTLNEAREFSLELIKILKSYEKANNEFESISQKLKLSHECLFS